ncbi:hypothetical protein, partial [Escherichia coli]|uniref:hypothetical protein n=1 Tax=Escherichia coli TaxID=562 RepID=UPI001BC86116
MLPSETMIWQPEFTDKTLSRKTGAVQTRHPDLIWGCRSERLGQQIWRNWQIVVRVRSRSE